MKLWPWPARAERKRRVARATEFASRAGEAARKAEDLAADLRRMEKDKLAAAIIEGLQADQEDGCA